VFTLVSLALVSLVAIPSPAFLVALAALLHSAPQFLDTLWQISADVLGLFAVVMLVAPAVRRRWDVVRDLLVSIAVAVFVWMLVGRWVQGHWPAVWNSLRSATPPAWYPSPRIAVPTALIVAAAPHLTRPIRRVGRWLVVLGSVGVVALGATSLLGALAGVLVGTAAAATVHLLFGSSAGRPSLADVGRALSNMGVEAGSISAADRQYAGVFDVRCRGADGEPLVVKVYGRDAHDSALAATVWRTLWYRENRSPARFGRLQQVEHEALVTLLAAQSGVLTDQVVTAGVTVDDDAVLVMRSRGIELTAVAGPQAAELMVQLWSALADLHRGGIAHGRIDRESLIVENGRLGLVDFGAASIGAASARIDSDRAQAFVTSVLLVGADTALDIARTALDREKLTAMLPHLQAAVLTSSQRHDVKAAELDLDDLRARAAGVLDVEAPELLKLRRLSVGLVLRVVLPVLAIVALTSAISGLELDGVWDHIVHATLWLLVLGFVVAQLTRLSQGVAAVGASPTPIPLGPAYALQLSVGYITIAVPSYAARVAMYVRFMQRQGVPMGAALAAGTLDTMTTFFVEVIGITALLLFTPASLDFDFSGTSDMASRLLTVAGVLIVVVFVVAAVSGRLRRMVVDFVRRFAGETMATLRGLRSPRRLLLLLGGNVSTEVLFTLALGVFARSMGATIPFADLLLIHLTVSLLAGLVPVPGGMGVAEAILTYGLIKAGMDDGAAFAAVIMYRASTFYLPPTWGFVAMRWLERNKYL
jgi:uncharacterized membrane protein YbhN (UPF0104 family)